MVETLYRTQSQQHIFLCLLSKQTPVRRVCSPYSAIDESLKAVGTFEVHAMIPPFNEITNHFPTQ